MYVVITELCRRGGDDCGQVGEEESLFEKSWQTLIRPCSHTPQKQPKTYTQHCRNHVRAVLCHLCSNRRPALMRGTCGPRSPTGWTSPMTNRCPSTLCAHRMGPIRRAERCFCARPGASARASIRLLGQSHFLSTLWP